MENYFRYLPAHPDLMTWGLVLSAAGFSRIEAQSTYPPGIHPEGYELDWEHGRVIEAMQIVLISEGSGWLQTRAMELQRIEAGMVFVLLPGSWHRYRPDPQTGWVESWAEVRGPVVEQLIAANTFPESAVLQRGGIGEGIEDTLSRIHLQLTGSDSANRPELAAMALQLLAQFSHLVHSPRHLTRIQEVVHQAERHFAEHYHEAIRMEPLARRFGVSYSHFRRAFRELTGMSPWSHVMALRLTHARAMLASSQATLEDIAAQTGFSSAFHLSATFKKAYGIAPDPWRRQLRDGMGGGS